MRNVSEYPGWNRGYALKKLEDVESQRTHEAKERRHRHGGPRPLPPSLPSKTVGASEVGQIDRRRTEKVARTHARPSNFLRCFPSFLCACVYWRKLRKCVGTAGGQGRRVRNAMRESAKEANGHKCQEKAGRRVSADCKGGKTRETYV